MGEVYRARDTKPDQPDAADHGAADETVAMGLTGAQQVVGTIPYMAPEQVRGTGPTDLTNQPAGGEPAGLH